MSANHPPIMVVNPPLTHPATPNPALLRALAQAGPGAHLYDANRQCLLARPGMEQAWKTLTSPEFYRPQACLKALLSLEHALEKQPSSAELTRLWERAQTARKPAGRLRLLLAVGQPGQAAAARHLAGMAAACYPRAALELVEGGDADAAAPAGPEPELLRRGFRPAAPELVFPPVPRELMAGDLDPMALAERGERLVLWRIPAELDSAAPAQARLRAAAKAGIWNHLLLPPKPHSPALAELARFAWEFPGQAHSWSWRDDPAWPRRDPAAPGRPWWSLLGHPAYLLLYLERHGRRRVRRWRLSAGGRLYTLGRNLEYHFRRPGEIPGPLLREIEALIVTGGRVGPDWVAHNLRRAFLIAYAREEGVVVGTETLKRPRPEYIQAVREQSGLDLSDYLERGYLAVLPHYRGLGVAKKLVDGLVRRSRGKKTFLAIPEDNLAPQELTKPWGTKPVATYVSDRVGKRVSIWISPEGEHV